MAITTRAYITKINDDNTFQVRVPFLEDNTKNEMIFNAILSCSPEFTGGFKVDDVVIVTFEGHEMDNAIIIGKMFTKESTSASLKPSFLEVTQNAKLPENTTIGYVKYQDLIDLMERVARLEEKAENL